MTTPNSRNIITPGALTLPKRHFPSKRNVKFAKTGNQYPQLTAEIKSNSTESAKAKVTAIETSIGKLDHTTRKKIYKAIGQFGKDAPLGMKLDGTEGAQENIKTAKEKVIRRLQDTLKNQRGNHYKTPPEPNLEDMKLGVFLATYSELENPTPETKTQGQIYEDQGITTIPFGKNQTVADQINFVANQIFEDLVASNSVLAETPETTGNEETNRKGPYIFSVLGNNSREGADSNIETYLAVVNQIKQSDQEGKEALLADFQQRAVFLCTGSAGKGTSLNYSVGKVAASLKPEFAKTIFNEDGSVKNELHGQTIEINGEHLTDRNGLQQLTSSKDNPNVTIKFELINNEMQGAVIMDSGTEIQNPTYFPIRRSGIETNPALLFGTTEAEFNEQIIEDYFQKYNAKNPDSQLTPTILVEPNSANTGQNMQMGAQKVEGFCKENSLDLTQSILTQSQRMQQSARSMPTAASQFSTEGLNGPPAWKAIFNLDAQFDAGIAANQSSDSQTIDIINALKEFAQAIKYSLGDAEKAFYGALDISKENFETFMNLTEALMLGTGDVTEETKDTITLSGALNFYSQLWPILESKILQGPESDNIRSLVENHAYPVIKTKVEDRVPNANITKADFLKLKYEAKVLQEKVEKFTQTHKNNKRFEAFSATIFKKLETMPNPENKNSSSLLKDYFDSIRGDLLKYNDMVSEMGLPDNISDPLLSLANFTVSYSIEKNKRESH